MNENDDPYLTNNHETRWELVASIISLAIILTFIILISGTAYGIFDLTLIPQMWFALYSFLVSVTIVWTFGAETVLVLKELRNRRNDDTES